MGAFSSDAPSTTTPVEHPTWYGEIRYMFTDTDDAHMQNVGLDLTNYDAVKTSAATIYGQVAAGNMPPGSPWSKAWVDTFLNWMTDKFPKGTNTTSSKAMAAMSAAAVPASRIRNDIATLSDEEMTLLKKAFSTVMSEDPSNPNSYFVQAGYHWLPAPLYCQHHAPAYNPWHRAYLVSFENALRSVPGCENVTLPYWDITTPFPDALKAPPFDKYTLPEDIGDGFNAGYVTERHPYDEIQQSLIQYGVTDDINRALSKTSWEDFHGWFGGSPHNTIIAAHDGGHVSIGPTMQEQSVAAFDPVFWFFHCNWDRLFWQWQQEMDATTLRGLMTTISSTDTESRNIFTIPVLQSLPPFTEEAPHLKTVDIVDSAQNLDIAYQHPVTMMAAMKLPQTKRSSPTSESFSVNTDHVNVRVSGVDRLKIPGSFKVHLLKDGKVIASKAVFQPTDAAACQNCAKNAHAHFDFELPLATVADGKLGVRVEPTDKTFVGDKFPDKLMGNPSVDVRLMLRNE